MIPDGTVLCNPGLVWGQVPLGELSGLALNGSPGQMSLCLALGAFALLQFWSMILALVSTATKGPFSGPKCSRPLQAGLDLCCFHGAFCPHQPTSCFSKWPES